MGNKILKPLAIVDYINKMGGQFCMEIYKVVEEAVYLEVLKYSLEQYIGFVVRQAFNYCCSLHQV